MLIGFLFGTFFIILTVYLGSKFPEKTIIQYSNELVGKWGAKLIGVLLFIFFIFAFITSANTLILHIKQYLLPQTPYFVICLFYTLLTLYGLHLGIEIIIRLSFFAFLMVLLLNVIIILGTLKDVDVMNLLPLMDKGIIPNLTASIITFGDLGFAILGLSIIYPMLNKKTGSISLAFWSSIAAIVLVIAWPLMETATMGADVMKQFTIVCMQHIRGVELTRFFPRSELIMVSLFSWAVYIQSTVMLFCCLYSLKQVTGIKKEYVTYIPLAITLIIGEYYLGFDHNRFADFLAYPWPQASAALSIGLPVLLLLLYIVHRKKLHKKLET